VKSLDYVVRKQLQLQLHITQPRRYTSSICVQNIVQSLKIMQLQITVYVPSQYFGRTEQAVPRRELATQVKTQNVTAIFFQNTGCSM